MNKTHKPETKCAKSNHQSTEELEWEGEEETPFVPKITCSALVTVGGQKV